MGRINRRKIVILCIFVFLVFLAIFYFWFEITTFIYPSYYRLINKGNKKIPSNTLVFERDGLQAGIWISQGSPNTEKQLVSIKSLYETTSSETKREVKFCGIPAISPDKTQIAFYLTSDDKEFVLTDTSPKFSNLYVYDLPTGKTRLLSQNVGLNRGYGPDLIWNQNSKFLLTTLKEGYGAKNKLFKINMFGIKKKVGRSYAGEVFSPRYINKNIIAFNTDISDTHSLGVVYTVLDWPYIYDIGEVYGGVYPGLYFSKDGIALKVSGGTYNEYPFKQDEINGLIKYYYGKGVQTYKIPSDYYNTGTNIGLMVNLICKNLAFLIESDGKYHEYVPGKPDNYYVFNLDSSELQKLPITDQLETYPQCNLDMGRVEQLTAENVIEYYLNDPIHPRKYNYTKMLNTVGVSDNTGLFVNLYNFQKNLLFVQIVSGQGTPLYPEREGLYLIDLTQNRARQYTFPNEAFSDKYIYYRD